MRGFFFEKQTGSRLSPETRLSASRPATGPPTPFPHGICSIVFVVDIDADEKNINR